MQRKKGFTLIELLVVISIIALLLAVLVPALRKAKDLAQSMVCQTNLGSLQRGFQLYALDRDGKVFFMYVTTSFIKPVAQYLDDVDAVRYCPEAPEKRWDDIGWVGTADRPWGWDTDGDGALDEGGSYTFNGFFYQPVPEQTWGNPPDWHGASKNYWTAAWFQSIDDVRQPASTPVFSDGLWVDTFPDHDSLPPTSKEELYTGILVPVWDSQGGSFMGRICVDRHDMAINVVFADGHTENVDLPDLWTLQWHKMFKPRHDVQMPRR